MVPMGMSTAPSIWQSANSCGSRTSTRSTFSPRSRRCFTSRGKISRSFIYTPKRGAPDRVGAATHAHLRSLIAREQAAEHRKHHKDHDAHYQTAKKKTSEFACATSSHDDLP